MPLPFQEKLFATLTTQLPAHISLAAEVSALLDISLDSAYRRIRGNTALSLDEAIVLGNRFGLSLDGLSEAGKSRVHFSTGGMDPGREGLGTRFQKVQEALAALSDARKPELVYLSMEFPVFHLLQSPLLLAFKLHYWQWIDQEQPTEKGVIDLQAHTDLAPYNRILNLYQRIPVTEIIHEDALSTTMMQILFFLESGSFARPSDALLLFDELQELVDHVRTEVRLGRKFLKGTPPPDESLDSNYQLYYNEMIYSQNVACLQTERGGAVFLEQNVLDFLYTSDPEFYRHTRRTLDKIMRKSVLISQVGERERNKFFNRLDQGIARMRGRAEGRIE